MWPKIYAATSHCPHFPTTQRVWGLHSFHPLDVVAPGVRSGRNDGFEKGTSKNYFDNSLLHSKLSTFSLSPPCQSIAPLNMSSLKPESKICKKKESFANKAVPIANDKYLKHFLKKKKKYWKQSLVTGVNPHRKRNKSLWHVLMYTISLKHLFLSIFHTSFPLFPMLLLFWPSGDSLASRWYQENWGYCMQLRVSILVN